MARHIIFFRVHIGFLRRHVRIWRDYVVFHTTIREDEIHRHVALPVILPMMCRRRGTIFYLPKSPKIVRVTGMSTYFLRCPHTFLRVTNAIASTQCKFECPRVSGDMTQDITKNEGFL